MKKKKPERFPAALHFNCNLTYKRCELDFESYVSVLRLDIFYCVRAIVTFRRERVHASHVMAAARAGGAQVIALIHVYKYCEYSVV